MYEVNLPTTFRDPLWVPSSLVMSQSVNEQRSGMPHYIGVERMWAESAVCSSGQSDLRRTQIRLATAASGNSPRTPCKNPKTKNQYSFHGGSLKSRVYKSDSKTLSLKKEPVAGSCEHSGSIK